MKGHAAECFGTFWLVQGGVEARCSPLRFREWASA